MMRSNKLNWYNHGGYTKITSPYLNVIVTSESKSKCSIIIEKLSQSCSTHENESKRSIVNKPFSKNFFAKENKFCSTKKYESECANEKQKDAKNEVA